MSVWTHILGVIRFDSMYLNATTQPDWREKLSFEKHLILSSFSGLLPEGSEGPMFIDCIITLFFVLVNIN